MFEYVINYKHPILTKLEENLRIPDDINCFLAGGALTSMLRSGHWDIKDYDIFFHSLKDFNELKQQLIETNAIVTKKTFLGKVTIPLIYRSPNAETFYLNKISEQISLIKRIYGNPEQVLSTFDFTVCTCAYVFKEKKLIFHKYFWEDIKNRRIRLVDTTISNCQRSKYRLLSYVHSKGFINKENITPEELCPRCMDRLSCLTEGKDLCKHESF